MGVQDARARCAAIAGALAALALTSLPACTPAAIVGPSLLRLRGGSSPYRGGLWGSPSEPKVTVDELRKNMHSLLEKHASGVMGRDLRRLFKEVRAVASAMPSTPLSRTASECVGSLVRARCWLLLCPCVCRWLDQGARTRIHAQVNGKELPLNDFGVQRPIELVEKELTDTVYYTREVSCHATCHGLKRAACRLLTVLEWRAQLDGDVKYFLKKKSAEAGPRPLWELTCHGDDNCQSVVVGDTSYEELKLQVSPCVAQSVVLLGVEAMS
jgi:hypothetical protein